MIAIRLTLGAVAAIAAFFAAADALAIDLTVRVPGVRSAEGALRVALYSDPATFTDESRALKVLSPPATPGQDQLVFHGLAPGQYALIVYHDENGNGQLDRVLGLFPKEGWGLSNDPEVTGPPSFAEAVFDLPAEGRTIVIPLHY